LAVLFKIFPLFFLGKKNGKNAIVGHECVRSLFLRLEVEVPKGRIFEHSLTRTDAPVQAGETVALINRLDVLDTAWIVTLGSCVPRFFVSAKVGCPKICVSNT
jgi:hypothetical protein